MKQKMILLTAALLVGMLGSAAAYGVTASPVLYTAAITFGTTFYHLAMRLAVGYGVDARFHNRMDDTRWWFQERGFEKALYRFLGVRRWKRWLPAFRPEDFQLRDHSPRELIQATCQSEVVHEIIMALSFVPVLFSLWFGSAGVFLWTSCMSFLLDGACVVVQRYNRPRLRKLYKK